MIRAGVSRVCINPFWGVELTGWGYYIERRWRNIADSLSATALVLESDDERIALITVDLMVIDTEFAERVREIVARETGINKHAILITCSHSHNAPAAGGLLGVGECDPHYEAWAAHQAATAAIRAWHERIPTRVSHARDQVPGISYNRTRPNGDIDAALTLLRVDHAASGAPLALVVNFAAHPTVTTELIPWHVSRDVPGLVCDGLESAFPGSLALYVQGACGDVNFLREFVHRDRYREPADRLIRESVRLANQSQPMQDPVIAASSQNTALPTRRWRREEIEADRGEAQRRLSGPTVDVIGWRDSLGRSMTNNPDDMIRRHGGDVSKAVRAMCRFHIEWTDKMLVDFETRPESLVTEVQALRIGDLAIMANASEFFAPFALEIRERLGHSSLMFACYSNGRIGYLPDRYDIEARSYAGYQSPKYCDQFPFRPESGPRMCDAMIETLKRC